MLNWWSGVVAERAKAVLVGSVLIVLAAGIYGFGVFDDLSQGGFDDPDTESFIQLETERELFGTQTPQVIAVYTSDELAGDDPAFREAVTDVLADLPTEPVDRIFSPYDTAIPAEMRLPLASEDLGTVQVPIFLAGETQNDYIVNYRAIEDRLAIEGPAADRIDSTLAGEYAVYSNINEITQEDAKNAELIALPLVVLLALLIFGSATAAMMPALVGGLALVGALAAVRLITVFTDVSIFAVNIVSLIGIGLAIDYALFVVSRFREELAGIPESSMSNRAAAGVAVRTTMNTAGRTVLFSGLTVAAAMGSLIVFPQDFVKSMAYGGAAAVLVAMLASLTALPAVLVLLGRRVDAGRLPWRRNKPVSAVGGEFWGRMARGVMRRPVTVLVVTGAALLVLAAPFTGVKWGSVDYQILPEDAAAYESSELLIDEFGAQRAEANLLIRDADQADVQAYAGEVTALDPTMQVEPRAQEGDALLLVASWEGATQSEFSQDLVEEIRAVDLGSGEVLVGGMTARTVDLIDSIAEHLPYMALIVAIIMFGLLFFAFGSVILPIKAIVMNLFSIAAAFGVVVWVFADGNLNGLLNINSLGYLDVTNPILMLAILFGLSMDYEVFLLSRVREEWDRLADSGLDPAERNRLAVEAGVQKTGRIITSAAILLGVVIGAFSLSGIVFMKVFGLGMLFALLLDATVVRGLLVPAAMKLLGKWNWYAPGPMARWWEKYGFREEPEAPSAEASEERQPELV